MAKIKVCGIRRLEDIVFLNKYLPEYAGFVFAESKRQVTAQQVKQLVQYLNKSVGRVGVFVNEDPDKVAFTAKDCGLDAVQIHGDETAGYIQGLKKSLQNLNTKIWKAVRVKDSNSLNELDNFEADAFLLDAYSNEAYGGTGKTFDWNLAAKVSEKNKIILAGGLNCHNVINARNIARPFGIDVSSGVETDGVKDERKIKDFLSVARGYDM